MAVSALALTLVTPSMVLAGEPESTGLSEPLEVLASRAATPADHLHVARHFRARAETLEVKAAEHVYEAARLRRQGPDPFQTKWRHALPDPVRRADEAALEARRAARQARELSSHHLQLAIEAGLARSPR
jgi:hypothetical protein